jgi:hypothetical protein
MKVRILDFESKSGSLKQRLEGIVQAMGLSDAERQLLKANLHILEIRRIRKSGYSFPKFPHKALEASNPARIFWEDYVRCNPADIYIIDPMRSLHSADENDSAIEAMLAEIQRIFKDAAVIIAHHMRKPGDNSCQLSQDMRTWSEGARGSSAIKAHSDVIVLQERNIDDKGNEIIHLGAFLKDGADVDPFPLMESDHESFFWKRTAQVPETLRKSFDAMSGDGFKDKASAATIIMKKTGASRATVYRHLEALIRLGLIGEESGHIRIKQTHD